MKKRILVLGIGGTGAEALHTVMQKDPTCALPIVFDLDRIALENIPVSNQIDLSSVDIMGAVMDQIGYQDAGWEFFGEYSEASMDYAAVSRLDRGSGGWRAKALLAFFAFCKDPEKKALLDGTIDRLFEDAEEGDRYEILSVASLAGGTGSGLLIPLTLYVKQYIRKNHGVSPYTAALLTCPAVHTNLMPENRRSIAEANAYATMRELNAINLAARGYFQKENLASPTRFRIGSEKDPAVGILFDSHDPRFATPEAAPFKKVYLYEKSNAEKALPFQLDIFSKVLFALCHADWDHSVCKPESEYSTVFAGISASQLDANAEKLVSYIVSKKLFEAVSHDWNPLSDAVARRQGKNMENARIYGLRTTGNDANLIDLVFETGADLVFQMDEARAEEEFRRGEELSRPPQEPFANLVNAKALFGDLQQAVNNFVSDDAARKFTESLAQPLYPLDEKKLKEPAKRESTLNGARALAEELRKLNAVNYLPLSDAQRNLIADFTKAAVSFEGHFLRPDLAWIRLCNFCKYVRNYAHELTDLEEGNVFTDEALFTLRSPFFSAGSLYGKRSPDRFLRLIEGRDSSKKKKFSRTAWKSESTVRKDVSEIFTRILTRRCRDVVANISEALDRLALSYQKLFQSSRRHWCSLLREDTEQLLRYAGTATPGRTDLFSAGDYERAYTAFSDTDPDQEDFCNLSGKIFYEGALQEADSRDVLENLKAMVRDRYLTSDSYRDSVNRDLFDLLIEKNKKARDYSDKIFQRVFRLSESCLRVTVPETLHRTGYAVRAKSSVFLPPDANKAPEELYALGIPESRFLKSDRLGRSILVISETSAIQLSFLNQFSEKLRDLNCYHSYRKCLLQMQQYGTAMLYPHAVGALKYSESLPFIHPEKQEEYRRRIARSLLYLFVSGSLFIEPYQSDDPVFCIREGNIPPRPVTVENATIPGNDWVMFLCWLRRHPAKTEEWSRAYEQELDRELNQLPGYGIGDMSFAPLMRAIDHSRIIDLMKNNLFAKSTCQIPQAEQGLYRFAYELHLQEEGTGGFGDAEALLLEGCRTVSRFCSHRFPENNSEGPTVLSKIENDEFRNALPIKDPNTDDMLLWMKNCDGFPAEFGIDHLCP